MHLIHCQVEPVSYTHLIKEYVKKYPDIYFACKALNYRTFKGKWDGDRPLSVQVLWNAKENRLVPKLIYDKPLIIKGNEVAGRLLQYMKLLNIKTTDDICLLYTSRCV